MRPRYQYQLEMLGLLHLVPRLLSPAAAFKPYKTPSGSSSSAKYTTSGSSSVSTNRKFLILLSCFAANDRCLRLDSNRTKPTPPGTVHSPTASHLFTPSSAENGILGSSPLAARSYRSRARRSFASISNGGAPPYTQNASPPPEEAARFDDTFDLDAPSDDDDFCRYFGRIIEGVDSTTSDSRTSVDIIDIPDSPQCTDRKPLLLHGGEIIDIPDSPEPPTSRKSADGSPGKQLFVGAGRASSPIFIRDSPGPSYSANDGGAIFYPYFDKEVDVRGSEPSVFANWALTTKVQVLIYRVSPILLYRS